MRLEIVVTHTKQTSAPQFNRQQFAAPRNTSCSHESRVANHESRIAASLLDTNGRFRRNNNSRNSFKTNDRVNSYSIQTATSALTCHSSQVTHHRLSNRQPARLEIVVSHTKQTPAINFNRQLFGTLGIHFHKLATLNQSIDVPLFTNHHSLITNHASLLTSHESRFTALSATIFVSQSAHTATRGPHG